ncbi:hypothetical protein SAMN05920897_108132 [Alkalispirochaeta americana]|uniref:SAP domain-containing protein n=1 Tax=Alkalispirochaeta americana TaxID=159291 RepID=A0A1N6SLB0_9SPIO|nr:hypothetical protein [Alkalispirochaeta americana]SIQ41898.1 hypothetical protein SAMN05920897_108132 [Alkalispirochaeta americana]
MAEIADWIAAQAPVLERTLTVQELKTICTDLTGHPGKGTKQELLERLLEFLSFKDSQKVFNSWFKSSPTYFQAALEQAAFRDYIAIHDIPELRSIDVITHRDAYRTSYEMNPKLSLGMFTPCTDAFIGLKPGLRAIFMHWLPKPEQFPLRPQEDQSPESVWSNEHALGESIPLLFKALDKYLQEQEDLEKVCRKGLNKSQIKSVRAVCAQRPFPQGQTINLDPINVLARFLPFFDWDSATRPQRIQDRIKQLVNNFFATQLPEDADPMLAYHHSGMYEYDVITSHLSRMTGKPVYPSHLWFSPPSRHYTHELLLTIAKEQKWHDIEQTLLGMEMQDLEISCLPADVLQTLRYKATAINIRNYTLSSPDYYHYLHPYQIFKRHLLDAPAMKAYCYLMATLGVLEIAETTPARPVTHRDKMLPVSPYDALKAIRVTDFGRWCLGLQDERPEIARPEFEALADRDLLLVTLKGTSLERRLFLDDIGEKLGEDRYRITPGSFIGKCTSTADIRERIDLFHHLIDQEPAPHWESFFVNLLERARAFSDHEECTLFSLPDDPDLRRLLSTDRKLSSMAFRAEKGHLAVPKSQIKKFLKLIQDAGYLPPL